MGLLDLVRSFSTSKAARGDMIDSLESRSMFSASGTVTDFTAQPDGTITSTSYSVLAAQKATVTSVRVYTTTSALGESVKISANVAARSTAIPGGTITFMTDTDAVLGTATLDSNGVATIKTAALTSGTTLISAVYSGNSRFASSASTSVAHTVTLGASTTKLSVTSDTSTTLGIATTLLAKVGSATGGTVPTGRVAFYDGGTLLASKVVNSAGAARLTANYLYTGSHDLKAIYLGDASYLGHRSSVKTVSVALPTMSTASDGLQVGVVTAGTGSTAATGATITADYTGYLTDGTKFQSSLDSGSPFSFTLGVGQVIPGFDEGLANVRAGEKRVLIIPSALGYGDTAQSGIPANSTLVFVVDVLSIS